MNNWAVHVLRNKSRTKAIIDDFGSITYQELSEYVTNYASYLIERNIGPGDRVLVTSNNNADTIIAILAITYVGGTVCMLSPNVPTSKIASSITETRAQLHIKDGNRVRFEHATHTPIPHDYPMDAEGFMLTTSGTTGYQKFIVHRQSVYFDYFKLINTVHGIKEDSVVFCGPKIHWGYGYSINLIPCLGKGATIVLTDKIRKTKDFCRMLTEVKATHLFTVPVFGELLVRGRPTKAQIESIQSLENIFIAGDIFPRRLRERFNEIYGRYMHNGWGQTEVLSYAILDHADSDVYEDYRSIGKVIKGCEIKIENNELYVKSPCRAMGYLDDPASTSEIFKGDWVKTNDLVKLENDHVIFLHRKGNRIKIRGEFYAVDDIEQVIMDTGLVYECLVSPQTKDGELGLNIRLISDSDVVEPIRRSIEHFKIDKHIEMATELPKTYTNKKLRVKA